MTQNECNHANTASVIETLSVQEGIDQRAIVNSNAIIGTNVSIGPFSIIEGGVVIGDNVQIGAHAFIGAGSAIGRGCRIFHGVVIGTEPQDLKYRGEKTTVEIGEETVLREYCTIHRGSSHRKKTTIGKRNYFMAYCHAGHDCVIGDNVIMANAVNLGGHVVVEDFANLGGLVGVHQFVQIGKHAFIAGGYRVIKDVPPYIIAGGEPLEFCGLNTVGLARRGFTKEKIDEIKNVYRIVYRANFNVTQAVKKIQSELSITPEIQEILNFVNSSQRGIIPAGRS